MNLVTVIPLVDSEDKHDVFLGMDKAKEACLRNMNNKDCMSYKRIIYSLWGNQLLSL